MTGMGIARLTVGKVLNHAEQGVTKVYDRHSSDAEKRRALNAWAPQDFTMQGVFDRVRVVGDLWARLRNSTPADLRAAFRYVD